MIQLEHILGPITLEAALQNRIRARIHPRWRYKLRYVFATLYHYVSSVCFLHTEMR